MDSGLLGAWLVAEALVAWRQVHGTGRPPVPGKLLAVTGLFGALAITADVFPRAKPVIVVTKWGIDLAGFLNLRPAGLGAQVQQAEASGTTSASGSASTAGAGA